MAKFIRKDGGVVKVFRRADLRFEWAGGHTVNVFDSSGKAIESFSVGDFATGIITDKQVLRGVNNWARLIQMERRRGNY